MIPDPTCGWNSIIPIYIGSDPRMGAAETALAYSIRKHASRPVQLTWMRAGDPGWKVGTAAEVAAGTADWDIGRAPGLPYTSTGWATDFTCFRWAVPELARKAGYARAIYLDVDMVVFADVAELIDFDLGGLAFGRAAGRSDVMVFDCLHPFWQSEAWPSVDDMQTTCRGMSMLLTLCPPSATLPAEWDELARYTPGKTKLRHFTNMRTQPWKPWPEAFTYKTLDGDSELFWKIHREAIGEKEKEGNPR